ncbi:hypothetical protein HK102_005287 [Quaeritorhiza haematococci]|nr:hypothetical protein HK102_005287 [Quaeritorhiza haematococci]
MTVFPVAAPNVAVNAPPSTSGPTYHDVICSHLYHNGFGQGLYSDMLLRIQSPHGSTGSLKHQPIPDGTAFKLHRIIAIRSPYLASLLQELEMNGDGFTHSLDITIPVNDPNITTEGLSIALGHLYASFSHALLTTPSPTPNHRSVMLRSVLAASNLLHLADLASFATELIKGDVSRMTVLEYCLFVNQHEWGGNYGSWSQEIRDAVFGYLCKGVVRELAEKIGPIWGMREGESYKELVKIFADLPFEWLKKVVESKLFEVPSDMERYYFAKEVIALRSRNQPPASTLIAGEENVLLAFGANKPGTSGGVTIVRKAPKGQHAAALNGGMGVAGAVGAGRVGYAPERKIWKVQTH